MNKKKITIYSYLIKRTSIIVLITASLIIAFVYQFGIKKSKSIVFANLNNHIEFEQIIIDKFIYDSKDTFRNIELLYLLDKNLSSNQSINEFDIEHRQITQIIFLDDEGIVQHIYPEDSIFSDYDFSSLDIFNNITEEVKFSDVFINNLTGNNEICLSKKIDSMNLIVSYIIDSNLFAPFDYLEFEIFDTQIIDGNNLVIYSNKNNYTYNKPNIVKTETITYDNTSLLISEVRTINGKTSYSIDRNIEPLSWTIYFSVDDAYLNKFIYPIYYAIPLIIIIMLLLSIYQIKIFIKKFNEPLSYINNHFDEIAEYSIVPFSPPNSIFKETTELYHHYDSMLEKIKNHEKELNQFVYIASHDLQEPLRTIYSYIRIIEIEYFKDLDEEGKKYFNYVTAGAKRMKTLIEDLLLYSRVNTKYNMINVDLNDLLNNVKKNIILSIEEKNAIINVGTLPIVIGDKNRLSQLIQNLILNSLKYSKNDIQPIINIYYQENTKEIIFEDNGIGIEEKYLTDIFKPFRKLHSISEYSGTGIGLAICEKVVNYHSWEIYTKSEFGIGTQFIININKE
jgi:signal transduction histidine kinase